MTKTSNPHRRAKSTLQKWEFGGLRNLSKERQILLDKVAAAAGVTILAAVTTLYLFLIGVLLFDWDFKVLALYWWLILIPFGVVAATFGARYAYNVTVNHRKQSTRLNVNGLINKLDQDDEDAAAISRAITLGRRIEDHPAFTSEWLSEHRLQLNPREEALQIAANRLRCSELIEKGNSSAVRATLRESLAPAFVVEQERLAALEQYLRQLNELQPLLNEWYDETERASLESEVQEIVATAQLANTDRLDGLAQQLKALTSGLRDTLTILEKQETKLELFSE